MVISSTARTHVGCVRSGNEDAVASSDSVWVVADGLGGHAGGEVASEVAVEACQHALENPSPNVTAEETLQHAFNQAHDAVSSVGAARRKLSGMGTTLVAAYADRAGVVHIGSVGDSRAYLLTDAGLHQLTRDDNVAEELLALGELSAEQARTHRGQFMLTKALIADDRNRYQPQIVSVTGPGRLLLCTDGLNAELDDREIGALLSIDDRDEAADALIAATLDAGGSDNVTVAIIDLPAAH